MNGLTRRWLLPDDPRDMEVDPITGIDPLVRRVLASRGVTTPDVVQRFCDPRLQHLPDPGLLPGADAAAARLADALRQGEPIVIYGDYDVDGITGTAILHQVLTSVAPDADIRTYIPHRLDEGYGLNADALHALADEGARVVVTVDCGITARDEARAARERGIDLIITDHHHLPPPDALPEAFALVHPRLPGSAYPFGELAGAGVAFKLAWRFATVWAGSERVGDALRETLMHMLPLVALGTIADVVPLVGENRVLATFGLRLIQQTPLVGLRALIEASDLTGESIDAEKVGFVLGPRLNACGRMGHAGEAVELFTTKDPAVAQPIAERLARFNRDRQNTERRITTQAMDMAVEAGMTEPGRRAIVLAHDDWHPGVIGIVCSRLVDRFCRPTVLMQRQGEICKGSARSIDGYSIHGGLTACDPHLLTFGGHDAAAGLSLATDNLDAFTDALTAHANDAITTEQLTPSLRIDCDAALDEFDLETIRRVRALSPFGRDNPAPAMRLQELVVDAPPRQMGANGKHLSLQLRQETASGRRVIRAVWWNKGSLAGEIASGMRVDAVVEPKINTWNGRTNVEAQVRDVRVCAPA